MNRTSSQSINHHVGNIW